MGRKAVAETTYIEEFADGDTFPLEFVWFLNFNEDGTKVTNIIEWVDSLQSVKFEHKVQAELAKKTAE